MPNAVAGIVLIACGLWGVRFTYRGFRDGNMTMSAIAPAYRDKQPIFFWLYTCLGVAFACLGLVGGLFAIFDRN
jgi:hypothetical protein